MYHGSAHHDIKSLQPNRDEFMIDRAIGSHFAADKAVSQRFAAQGHSLYGGEKPKEPGVVYKAKAPPRSQLHVVHQQNYRDKDGKVFAKQSDQDAIASHVAGTVFSQPEHKQMFKDWVKHARRVDDATAEGIHASLSRGEAPSRKKFGDIAGSDKRNSFHAYVSNFGSTLQEPRPGFKREVVDKYLGIMHKRGIKGLVYTNTSPMETHHDTHDDRTSNKVRSTKSYVIFHPHELELQHDNS